MARPRRRLRIEHLVRDAVALGIGDRLLGGRKPQPHLLAHVAGRGPAHQRLDLARLLGLVVEHPFPGLGGARLHRRLRRLVDPCHHDRACLPFARCGLVGAAGFEPATFWSQTRRATRLRYAPGRRAGTRYTVRFWPASARRRPAGDPQAAPEPHVWTSWEMCGIMAGRLVARPGRSGTPSGRTSAAIRPLGPGPKRTSTNWPGRSSVMP